MQDSYHLDYSDQQYGLCGQSLSYVTPCAGRLKFLFHFKHCDQGAALHGLGQIIIIIILFYN